MGHSDGGELYHDRMIGILERLWGDGWLSPGGPDEVRRLLEGMDLTGKSILDIGCGAGGIDVLLVQEFGAGYVCGIDVEDTVLANARARAGKAGCADRIGVVKVVPGPLPFPPGTFDIVFSKDSIVHIPDKHTLMRDVFRVLKPGGWFVASDWLIGHDNEPSPQMKDYIASEGLDFGMASRSATGMHWRKPASATSPSAAATPGTGAGAAGTRHAERADLRRGGGSARPGFCRPQHHDLAQHDSGARFRRALPHAFARLQAEGVSGPSGVKCRGKNTAASANSVFSASSRV